MVDGKEPTPVYCRDCPRYDLDASRCKDGKVNPPKWEIAVTTAQVLGVRAICTFNPHRERLIHSRNMK
ncbi:hypothetical protein EON79_02205 [bacterium]|nr:MAG: hypothetical protein EON79_02205 [bacterium]